MALIQNGAGTQTLGMDQIKSIVVSSSNATTRVVITNSASQVVMDLSVGANSCQQIMMPGQAGMTMPMDRNSSVVVTGAGAFVRID